jgi:hypothetical protein
VCGAKEEKEKKAPLEKKGKEEKQAKVRSRFSVLAK